MKRLNLTFALGLLALCTMGETLSPSEAWQRALSTSENLPRRVASAAAKATPELAATYQNGGQPGVYVFQASDAGYAVVSADDRTQALLGFSEGGVFDLANVPPALDWLLNCYARQATSARITATEAPSMAPRRTARANISPLLSTTWDQTQPYNGQCPYYNGKRLYTGCVATATAQIMKKFAYPDKGKGSHDYTTTSLGLSLSSDFSSHTYDWASMLDSYSDAYTQTQADAVALLMADLGVAFDMDYMTTASGAYPYAIGPAMHDYFSYSPDMAYLWRKHFDKEEWEDIIYSELSAGRPLNYSGQDTEASVGHQFVLDGYHNGYFHFNWGWSGSYDGLFLLEALNPDGTGIGGGTGTYNDNQDMWVAMAPQTYVPEAVHSWMSLDSSNGLYSLAVSASSGSLGSKFKWYTKDSEGLIFNAGITPITVTGLALEFVPAEGGDRVISDIATDPSDYSFDYLYGYYVNRRNILVPVPSTLANGVYYARPMYKTEADPEWKPVHISSENGNLNVWKFSVNDGQYNVSAVNMPNRKMQSGDFRDDLEYGYVAESRMMGYDGKTTGTVTVTNNLETEHSEDYRLYLFTYDEDNSVFQYTGASSDPAFHVTAGPGETFCEKMDFSFTGLSGLAEGWYYIGIGYGGIAYIREYVYLSNLPRLALEGHNIPDPFPYCNSFEAKLDISSSVSDYEEKITLSLLSSPDSDFSDFSDVLSETKYFTLPQDEVTTVNFTLPFNDFTYDPALHYAFQVNDVYLLSELIPVTFPGQLLKGSVKDDPEAVYADVPQALELELANDGWKSMVASGRIALFDPNDTEVACGMPVTDVALAPGEKKTVPLAEARFTSELTSDPLDTSCRFIPDEGETLTLDWAPVLYTSSHNPEYEMERYELVSTDCENGTAHVKISAAARLTGGYHRGALTLRSETNGVTLDCPFGGLWTGSLLDLGVKEFAFPVEHYDTDYPFNLYAGSTRLNATPLTVSFPDPDSVITGVREVSGHFLAIRDGQVLVEGARSLSLYSLTGLRVAAADAPALRVDTLQPGIYLLCAEFPDGSSKTVRLRLGR